MNLDNHPLVSVCCITYNHEKYIRDTIEGFLLQKTTFPIEIIIHDDASTDGTGEIVKEYADKHPDLFIPILQSVNQYSQGIRPSPTYVWPRARGKYIAFCEGDDYWIDENKLQKQVQYLESNPECGLVHSDTLILLNQNNVLLKSGIRNKPINKITVPYKGLILGTYPLFSNTVCARKDLVIAATENLSILHDQRLKMGDLPLWLYISLKTEVHYLDEVTSIYRVLPESASHSKSKIKQLDFQEAAETIKMYFLKNLKPDKTLQNIVNGNLLLIRLRRAYHTNNNILGLQSFRELLNNASNQRLNPFTYLYFFGSINQPLKALTYPLFFIRFTYLLFMEKLARRRNQIM